MRPECPIAMRVVATAPDTGIFGTGCLRDRELPKDFYRFASSKSFGRMFPAGRDRSRPVNPVRGSSSNSGQGAPFGVSSKTMRSPCLPMFRSITDPTSYCSRPTPAIHDPMEALLLVNRGLELAIVNIRNRKELADAGAGQFSGLGIADDVHAATTRRKPTAASGHKGVAPTIS